MTAKEFANKLDERMSHAQSPSVDRLQSAICDLFAAVLVESGSPVVAGIAAEHLYRLGEALASELR